MFVKDVKVENQVGLHARPATFFIQKANEYKSSIWVEKEERRVNAKSLLGVLSLGIMGGTDIRIIADGSDVAARAEKKSAQKSSDKITGAGETGFMPDIIIVEDNREIGTLLCDFLRKENYTVSLADTGEKALDIFERYGANLLVLDIGLPGVDGFSVCVKIRENSNAHILIASAKTDKESTLKGLQIGADDYISKPYDIDILLAKINGIFKRKYALDEIVCDHLRLNSVTQTLTVDGMPVNVTEKEFQLLKLLIENRGTTLKKEYLFNRIWGSDSESEMQTLTVHIKWLREKIEQDPKNPKHIVTVWGTGYRYEAL